MKFEIIKDKFYRDDKEIKIISGAVHYFRNMPDTWSDIFKKLRAVGCNCVETYCAWNMHEKNQGEFTFNGILDIAKFIKKAKKEGLMVIVRPGPYICAEWEFGGLPWWLQRYDDIEIRCSNARYMSFFKRYLSRLFDQIKPLLCTNGGPIIMLQCENEYGYYGDDKKYLQTLYSYYREMGIDVPLFTADGTSKNALLDGSVEGCFSTLNFGRRVQENFKIHDELFPNQPKMCMEMWDGWFDSWGQEHHTTSAKEYAGTLDDMLNKGSVNMYMFIGGTNFGFMSGANHNEKFAPDVTSYDYDALLSECGDVTEKYFAVREVIQKYNKEELPKIPKNRKKKGYGKLSACGFANLLDNLQTLSTPINMDVPKCMEDIGLGYGYVVYRTKLNREYEKVKLFFERVGDRAQVYVNKKYCGTVYVNNPPYQVEISAKEGDVLYVVCENMGRTNFGPKMMYKKGVVGRCLLDGKIHFGWQAYPLPMDNLDLLHFKKLTTQRKSESFYKFVFNLEEKPRDTFLRLDNFTKGFAILNGFNLGRFWEIGPQKTLYVPCSLLNCGENQLIVFESDKVKGEPIIEFVDKPDLG